MFTQFATLHQWRILAMAYTLRREYIGERITDTVSGGVVMVFHSVN